MFSKLATVSNAASTKLSSAPKTASAQSVASGLNGKASTVGSASITTIAPDEFEAFFASHAIEQSASSATRLTAFQELFNTCLAIAKPPIAWREARREWDKYVRETIARSRTWDSPAHVASAIDAGHLKDGGRLARWREIEPTFTPNVVPIWHDDSALKTCAKWMEGGGIVWTGHNFFAERLSQLTGAPYYAQGGFTADGRYIEDAKAGSAVIASIDANREGKNLQELWNRNLIVCPPPSGQWMEQTIARTHRPGQKADEVIVDVLIGCRENFDNVMTAFERARGVQEMTGKKQKLLLATVDLPSEGEIDAMRSPRWVR